MPACLEFDNKWPPGKVVHYPIKRECVPVLGTFWHENSGNGLYFQRDILRLLSNFS